MQQIPVLKILLLAMTGFFPTCSFAQNVVYAVPPGVFSEIQPAAEGLMTAKEKGSRVYGFIDTAGQ